MTKAPVKRIVASFCAELLGRIVYVYIPLPSDVHQLLLLAEIIPVPISTLREPVNEALASPCE